MSKPHILVNCPIDDQNRLTLPAGYNLQFIEEAPDRELFLKAVGASIQAIITDGPRDLGKDIFDRLPRLALIVNMGVGVERIDIAESERRGIFVTNARGTNAPRSRFSHAFGQHCGGFGLARKIW